jgi:UrcA family protein
MLYPHKKKSGMARMRATLTMIAACMACMACLGGVLALFASPARAATESEFRTEIVQYRDLDLASVQDRELLDQRIRRAAKQVCMAEGIASVLQRRMIRKCAEATYSNAWAIAQQRIGSYRLAVRAPE